MEVNTPTVLRRLFFGGRLDIVLLYMTILFSYFYSYGISLSFPVFFPALYALSVLVFVAYLGNRLYDYEGDKLRDLYAVQKNDWWLIFLIVLTISPYFMVKLLGIPVEPYKTPYMVGFLLVFFYSFPLFGKRIKNFFILKNVYAAFVWYLSIVFLLTLHFKIGTYSENFIEQLHLFLIFLVYEIVWDIKDTSSDRQTGVKTLPNTIGLWNTKIVIAALLFLSLFLVNFSLSSVIFWSALYLIFWTLFLDERKRIEYYHLIVGGQICIIFINLFL